MRRQQQRREQHLNYKAKRSVHHLNYKVKRGIHHLKIYSTSANAYLKVPLNILFCRKFLRFALQSLGTFFYVFDNNTSNQGTLTLKALTSPF